jgi:osmotically-inducible protein OsmY
MNTPPAQRPLHLALDTAGTRRGARPSALLLRLAAGLLLATTLAGCAPLIVGGAVIGGGLVATDRRTPGILLEDEGIERRANGVVSNLATLGRIGITSYNRRVLLTGEVPGASEKAAVVAAVKQVENVREVIDELVVAPNSPLGSRTNDSFLGTKVKATLVDAKDLQANAYKVVADRGVVYLMGRVTEREARRGAEVARSVGGVQKVVQVFEILSEAELAALGRPAATGAAAPAAPASAPPARP